MILNRSHVVWFWFTLLASAAVTFFYIGVFHPALLPGLHLPDWLARPRSQHSSVGNSPLGLFYGSLAYAIFIFAVLFNTRKKFPNARVGRAQTWLRAHIWLTVLTLPLVFMHAAFHFGGVMTSSLMWLYLVVMLSGFYGLALQQYLPKQMKRELPVETIYDEIPFLTQRLLHSALKMREELRAAPLDAEESSAPETVPGGAVATAVATPSTKALLDALEKEVLPYLAAQHPERRSLAIPFQSEAYFNALRLRVAPERQPWADQLAAWCSERRQMMLQVRYHRRMQSWLIVHVPASFLLIVLTGWHAVVTLFLY